MTSKDQLTPLRDIRLRVPTPQPYSSQSQTVEVDGLAFHYLEAGSGPDLVLLHGGEFGATAELSWEYNFASLSQKFHVIAPDWLGYGGTAKVHDFVDFADFKIRTMARFCLKLGLNGAPFVGNSMGANFLLRDAAAKAPLLEASAIVAISGGGPVPKNEARKALVEYDCSYEAMRRIIGALFHNEVWCQDEGYVQRRYESSLTPGAWECAAAARFHSPQGLPHALNKVRGANTVYGAIDIPVLLIAGSEDKLKPRGYGEVLASQIPHGNSLEVSGAGHCPQIERPDLVNEALLAFLA